MHLKPDQTPGGTDSPTGNAGLGKETVLQLAKNRPSKIFLAARSEQKAKDAIASIKPHVPDDVDITWLPLDLTSPDSIRDAAKSFHAQSSRLDRLILNAGIMATPPGRVAVTNHEIQFGTNHTGHFLLTNLLLPTLLKTAEEPGADVRVVAVSSVGHNLAPSFETFLDQDKLYNADPNVRYGASKASNILFAAELARRHPSLTAVSLHPGVIITDLYAPMSERSPVGALGAKALKAVGAQASTGALNQLWAAAGAKKEDLVNGAYYVPVGRRKPRNHYANSEDMGKRLWDWTEEELKKVGYLD